MTKTSELLEIIRDHCSQRELWVALESYMTWTDDPADVKAQKVAYFKGELLDA
jgi:hypothetical protein